MYIISRLSEDFRQKLVEDLLCLNIRWFFMVPKKSTFKCRKKDVLSEECSVKMELPPQSGVDGSVLWLCWDSPCRKHQRWSSEQFSLHTFPVVWLICYFNGLHTHTYMRAHTHTNRRFVKMCMCMHRIKILTGSFLHGRPFGRTLEGSKSNFKTWNWVI